MKRTKHGLSHYKLATFDMGELVPVGLLEALPGDTVQHRASCLIRVSPLLAPVMHPVQVRLHHWFVPHRIVWEGWEDFITGGQSGDAEEGNFPTITTDANTANEGTLADYLGVPDVSGLAVNALPFRGYQTIFNEYYRDQDLVTAAAVSKADGADATTETTMKKVAWEKDYFTAARAWAQRDDAVTLPLGTTAPVEKTGTFRLSDGGAVTNPTSIVRAAGAGTGLTTGSAGTAGSMDYFDGLRVNLASATAIDINTVRRAFALQRYQEARAMYGARYTEYLRYLGVNPQDARLNRPEYLGGGKATIAFSEILQTAPTTSGDDAGVGDLKGHGIAAMRARRYRYYVQEHGYIFTLMSVRPRSMYASGLERHWSRTTKEDFFQKELEHIGMQAVLNKEVYAAHATPGGTFGYNDRYAEYRHVPSTIAGEFRSTMNHYHLARIFGSTPALNSDFINCEPSKRIHAVTSADVLWTMVNHSIQARRLVGRPQQGRIL